MMKQKLIKVAAMMLAAVMSFGSFETTAYAATTKEDAILTLVNAERAKNGLKALKVDKDLKKAAEIRAKECEKAFSHTRPDGSAYYTVENKVMGENLAEMKPGMTDEMLVEAWMLSPSHKENLLWSSSTTTGIAVYTTADGTMYVAEEFN